VFIAIAIHHAAPERTGEFIDFMHRVIETTAGASGLIEFSACRDPGNGFLAGFLRWQSREAFQAALPTIQASCLCSTLKWTRNRTRSSRLSRSEPRGLA
jgi:quinol monooxygenase YgiN